MDFSKLWVSLGLLCAATGLCSAGCGADAVGSNNPGASGLPGGAPGAGGFAGTGAGASGTTVPGAGGPASPFGNSTTQPMMVVGGPTMDLKCKEPMVVFVVDGSGSMCAPFGNATRWTALRTALVDPMAGLIYKLQDRGDFGLFIYDGSIDIMLALTATSASPSPMCSGAGTRNRTMANGCLGMVEVAPGRAKAGAIDMAFPRMELGGSTPTDKAMNHEVDAMIAARDPNADPTLHPQYIILATDGQPNDICTGGMGGDGTAQQTAVLAAVDRAYQAGITTFVISMAGGDAMLEAHLNDVAHHGDLANPNAHTFSPMNPQDLVTALTTLLGSAFGCNIN